MNSYSVHIATLSLPLSWENTSKLCWHTYTCLYAEYSPPGSNLLIFPCQVEEKSETIRCLEDDLLRELEEKLLEMSQIMDPGIMAELEELANSKDRCEFSMHTHTVSMVSISV